MKNYHKSVLLQEIIDFLKIQPGAKYIDATLGGGGHTGGILERGGRVLGLDIDSDAIDHVLDQFRIQKSEFIINKDLVILRGNFGNIKKLAEEKGFGKVSGIIFDLGVSSHQIDTAERGFSFRREGPLDMRMDRELNVKAGDLLNILTKGELYELFAKLGEERFAYAIANSVVKSRGIKPITTTMEFTEIIGRVVRNEKVKSDAAARIYQALRIAVNDELNSLRRALPQAYDLLEENGILGVISFHSLEDRIVKKQFAEWVEAGRGRILTKKPVTPSEREVEENSRARSAKLRVFKKKSL